VPSGGAAAPLWPPGPVDRYFGLESVSAIVQALDAVAGTDDWARETAGLLRQRSPLMLHVTF
jgi:hypothetical protein